MINRSLLGAVVLLTLSLFALSPVMADQVVSTPSAVTGSVVAATPVPATPVTSTTIDFSPILSPIIQALGIVASLTALPALWWAVNWVRQKAGMSVLERDNAIRMAIDAGLQKSLGSGISQVQEAVAGLPMSISTKNKVIAQAATYAQQTMMDTLKAANLDDPTRLANAIEARLGLMEMQASTGSSAPGIAHAVTASSAPSVAATAAAAPQGRSA